MPLNMTQYERIDVATIQLSVALLGATKFFSRPVDAPPLVDLAAETTPLLDAVGGQSTAGPLVWCILVSPTKLRYVDDERGGPGVAAARLDFDTMETFTLCPEVKSRVTSTASQPRTTQWPATDTARDSGGVVADADHLGTEQGGRL